MAAFDSLDCKVGLFFATANELLLHTCSLDEGESYGDFINYPESHDDVWQRDYYCKYNVDFDYFPRGRIVYNRVKDEYLLYYDSCAASEAEAIYSRYSDGKCFLFLDEHYQCHMCNKGYII